MVLTSLAASNLTGDHVISQWALDSRSSSLYAAIKDKSRLTVSSKKPPAQANTQRWALDKKGYIALQHQPKFVIDIKGQAANGAQVVLSDSSAKNFEKQKSPLWAIISITPKHSGKSHGIVSIHWRSCIN
jgi:hypothetical protein